MKDGAVFSCGIPEKAGGEAKEASGMDRNEYEGARDAMRLLIDKAELEDASAIVAGIAWREGEPEGVCTGCVNIPAGDDAVTGMVALLLFSVLGRHFEDAEGRLIALDVASKAVRMLVERNPHARDITELADVELDLADRPGLQAQ